MPVVRLAAFSVFEASDFHIGGDSGQIEATESTWSLSAVGLDDEKASLKGVDFSGYIGSEGDALTELANSTFPSRVDSAADAVQKVTGAIDGYSQDYTTIKTKMDALTEVARGHHVAVDCAADALDAAEVSLAAAMASGNPAAIASAETHYVSCQGGAYTGDGCVGGG